MTISLFQPISVHSCQIQNRIVMAPMTRAKSPGNIPNEDNVAYYTARASGGVGLIITEGTYINPYAAESSFSEPRSVPHFYGDEALAGWKKVVEAVHKVGGKIFPQLWHVGGVRQTGLAPQPSWPGFGPSAVLHPQAHKKEPAKEMTLNDISNTIDDFVNCAVSAKQIGFDGIELHGAHGYLIDQFFWNKTNLRQDIYGGQTLKERTHFACEIIKSIRKKVGMEYPLCFRFSQWKIGDYHAKLANTPKELESFLLPLVDAGVSIFHASSRKFFEPEFEESHLNLAGWVKKITGKPTITVGSIGMESDFIEDYLNKQNSNKKIKTIEQTMDELSSRIDQGEFDFVALGRALIADPYFPQKVLRKDFDSIVTFNKSMLNIYP